MPTDQPQISVILATHNRRDLLGRCLEGLGRQTLDPASFEVVVADDGSSDGSAEMAEGLETPYRLRVLRLGKLGHAVTQNRALEFADGPVGVLLDDDVIPGAQLLEAHLGAHRRDPQTIGIGALSQQPVAAHDWYAHAFARAWNEHLEDLAHRPTTLSDCYGGNLSFPRQTMIEIGGVATDLAAAYDYDMGFRLSRAGCRLAFIAAARGVHDDQKRTPRILEDAQRSGRACVVLSDRYPELRPELLDWRGGGADSRELALRGQAISRRIPPLLLARSGWLIPDRGRKMFWLHLVRRLAFWIGVKEEATPSQWEELSR
jgi:glycosyltransferase involved in cell wall biosynthesis